MSQTPEMIAKDQLETLLDKHRLANILDMLRDICWDKARHVQENWQDECLANIWKARGNQIENFSQRFDLQLNIF